MVFFCTLSKAQLPWSSTLRYDALLDSGWLSVADSSGSTAHSGFQLPEFSDAGWKQVSVPHNWDDYGGYIRLKHGNRHGDSWYRKIFRTPKGTGSATGKQSSFLFFEGISSYTTIWLNGHQIGQHSGGRTSFTLDITSWLNKEGVQNLLAVKVAHPTNIRDLPWVCGGCSDEVGFSEGSQPFGIFRPVHLIQTGSVRIEPFGVHIWNDTTVSERAAHLYLETSVKNYGKKIQEILVEQVLLDHGGRIITRHTSQQKLPPGQQLQVKDQLTLSSNVHLWSLKSPYLYQLRTRLLLAGRDQPLDELTTPYGIRWIKWPDRSAAGAKQFLLNGQPVFINGIAGYEHALGKSHAFSAEEIRTRAQMVKAMGFNGFRDAHQPHNLRFQTYWDSTGILWWPQFSAHIWFDTPAFKKAFLSLLRDWVMERRNSPSNIMWGLQNESKLPKAFAEQCVRLIRRLDPTASGQRLVTTCNGGEGTDWDVPQNWTGTYGGDPDTYDQDLKKQLLVGEYGGWRSLDLYAEDSMFGQVTNSVSSWCALMEKKIKLAAKVKDSVCGQFLWLLGSHDNPGRVQAADGYRDLDRIGPVNYKGLLTSWEEPTDAFYLYQSNFTSGREAPMVYIVSHNWPDRWLSPGVKDGIEVYSNCDSVALYNGNGIGEQPLGVRTRAGIGTHFTWDRVDIQYNMLYAVGYVDGKAVVKDRVLLRHLPEAPLTKLRLSDKRAMDAKELLAPKPGYSYLCRVNCGGPAYTDKHGQQWAADRAVALPGGAGSLSWTNDYAGLPAFFASQRRISDPICGTEDPQLLQTFRYGRDKLSFQFPVPDGHYEIELYFVEPWWGKGGNMDYNGWRDFDVAVNGSVKIAHLDIFKEAGPLSALKKTVDVEVKTGMITVQFPNTYSGQAVISAIAVAKKRVKGIDRSSRSGAVSKNQMAYPYPEACLSWLPAEKLRSPWEVSDWLDQGDTLRLGIGGSVVTIGHLPPVLFGVNWLKSKTGFVRTAKTEVLKLVAQSELTTYLALGNVKDKAKNLPADIEQRLTQLGYSNRHEQVITDAGITSDVKIAEVEKSAGIHLDVYQKNWHKDDTVTFYRWQQTGLIAFKPLSHMQPPYDQKPEENFAPDKALHSENGHLTVQDGKSLLEFNGQKKNEQGKFSDSAWVRWTFITGVADFHALQIKYANASKDSVAAVLCLLSADGSIMERSAVILAPTRPGKWNSCSMNTKTMINAGHYQLKLSWKGGVHENLRFSSMKLQ